MTNNRTVDLTGVGGAPLSFDNLVYSPSVINQTLNFNAVEQWTLANVSNLDHTFHIHDIQFYLTSVPGGIPAYMQGWKDSFIHSLQDERLLHRQVRRLCQQHESRSCFTATFCNMRMAG